MDLFETIHGRRSVRTFRDEPVDPAMLERILISTNRAPSAANLQAYEIIVVTHQSTKEALVRAAYNQRFLAEASVLLAYVTNQGRSSEIEAVATQLLNASEEAAFALRQRGKNILCLQDATVACAYAQLAATALGLATIWAGLFDAQAVHDVLQLPPDCQPAALLAIGHEAQAPAETPRRALSDLVRLEAYGGARFTPSLDV